MCVSASFRPPRIFGSKGCLFYGGDDAEPGSGALELRSDRGELLPGFRFENTTCHGQ